MKKKRILITGGAGFIGSHLCKTLLNMNNDVICVDNLFTGTIDNISELLDNPNFEFIDHDIINPFYSDKIDDYKISIKNIVGQELSSIKLTNVIGEVNKKINTENLSSSLYIIELSNNNYSITKNLIIK